MGKGRLHQNKGSSIVRQVDLLTLQQDNKKIKKFHPDLLFHNNLCHQPTYYNIDATLELLPWAKATSTEKT